MLVTDSIGDWNNICGISMIISNAIKRFAFFSLLDLKQVY